MRCSISTAFLALVVNAGDVCAMLVKASKKKAEATASMSIIHFFYKFGCFPGKATRGGSGLLGCQIASLKKKIIGVESLR